jgi:hypothetical protein
MPAGAEDIQRLPVAEEDRLLALPHNDLRANAEIPRTLLWDAMHHLTTGGIKILDYVENPGHVTTSYSICPELL